MTPVTEKRREQLQQFIEQVLAPDTAVQAVVGIGSIAAGQMHDDSDIDAAIFLEPFDFYIAPAEAIWNPADDTFHSIFSDDPKLQQEGLPLDFFRINLNEWADPEFDWQEGYRSELSNGWMAFDRDGRVAELIKQRTTYPDDLRQERLDEAIIWLDQHLAGDQPKKRWLDLGPIIAHWRL